MVTMLTLFLLLLVALRSSAQQASCTYGARGSLTSTCTNAVPGYFRITSYRFDNLDETVRCVNCSLTTIEANTFDISGNQIKTLNLTSSQIVNLRPKAFIGLVFLRRLVLSNNRIVGVPAETFMGINKVETLELQNNAITRLMQAGFKELTNLRKLNLRNNQISAVEVGSFDGLASLEELDLSNNNINTAKDIFGGLFSIGIINLEHNMITQINSNDLKDLDSLVELNLASNLLKSIPESAFLTLPRLETLNLSSNPIDTVTVGSFRGLYALKILDLSNGAIPMVKKGLLANLHKLRQLDLSRNRIPVFETGVYTGLPELRILNLSLNKIEKYQKTGVFALHSLHTLDLSSNNLKDLDYKLLVEHLPRLSRLELVNNPWPCYLGKEMEEAFKQDNLVFTLGKQFDDPNLTCNDSRPTIVTPEEQAEVESNPEVARLIAESNGHEYVLYIFICITLGLIGFLFYLQYKVQKDIRDIVGQSNISEVQLLNASDGEARDY